MAATGWLVYVFMFTSMGLIPARDSFAAVSGELNVPAVGFFPSFSHSTNATDTSSDQGSTRTSSSTTLEHQRTTSQKISANSTTSGIRNARGVWFPAVGAIIIVTSGMGAVWCVLRRKRMQEMIIEDMTSLERWEASHKSDTLSSPIMRRRSPIFKKTEEATAPSTLIEKHFDEDTTVIEGPVKPPVQVINVEIGAGKTTTSSLEKKAIEQPSMEGKAGRSRGPAIQKPAIGKGTAEVPNLAVSKQKEPPVIPPETPEPSPIEEGITKEVPKAMVNEVLQRMMEELMRTRVSKGE